MKSDWKAFLSSVYGELAGFKNFLYETGYLDSVALPVPVLSIGNLSMGGTGKTPVTEMILSMARDKKIHVCVVARNYRSHSRGIHKVNLMKEQGASFYGDEAFMLAGKHPETPVWTGPKKYLTAQQAVQAEKCHLVLVDDGFQHRALDRHFDLVLLDCTADPAEDHLIPAGRLREDFSSLRRAQAVALTKVNWASQEQVDRLRSRIPAGVETFEIEFETLALSPIPESARILAVCGIAKPQTFSKSVQGLGSLQLVDTLVFEDHCDYGVREVHRILETFRRLECHQILTTEKDFVKLSRFSELKELLNPVKLKTRFRQEPQGLNAFLDQVARA